MIHFRMILTKDHGPEFRRLVGIDFPGTDHLGHNGGPRQEIVVLGLGESRRPTCKRAEGILAVDEIQSALSWCQEDAFLGREYGLLMFKNPIPEMHQQLFGNIGQIDRLSPVKSDHILIATNRFWMIEQIKNCRRILIDRIKFPVINCYQEILWKKIGTQSRQQFTGMLAIQPI